MESGHLMMFADTSLAIQHAKLNGFTIKHPTMSTNIEIQRNNWNLTKKNTGCWNCHQWLNPGEKVQFYRKLKGYIQMGI